MLLRWNVISSPLVKLNPPFNLTVKVGSDSNLYCYWNQTDPTCEENEVRYRINNGEWDVSQRRDNLSEITSILCLIYCLFISHRRIPSSAPGAVPSTSPLPPPSMRYRSAADWVTAAESPNSGVTGASLCCGDPTSTWLRQVNYLLLFLEMTNGVKMRKLLPSRSPSCRRVNVAMDRAVRHRNCPHHPVGRYVVAPWKVGYSWWSNRANLPPGHRKHNNITAVETFVLGSLKG